MRTCPAKRSGGHRRRRTRILGATVSRFKVVATLLPRLRLRGPPFGFRSLPTRLDRPRSAAVRAPLSPQASHASSSLAPQPFVASRSRFFSAPFRAVILTSSSKAGSMSSIAKKYLKKYRIYRRMGYSVRLARINALFSVSCGKKGASILLVQNHARRVSHFWS